MALSPCCDVSTTTDSYGQTLCTRCWSLVSKRKAKDLLDWLFPPEPGKRPVGEAVFVRYGKRVELLLSHEARGRPDSWAWWSGS